MPKPTPLKRIIKILKEKGFFFVSQKGSHAKYRKTNGQILTVIIPIHGKDIPRGTVKSIIRQAKLQQNDFE